MNATITFTDRELNDAEWGPARHDLARSAVSEATLAQRDAALAWPEDN